MAFETAITKHDVKLFIHCNPHNPVGHVWTENEMDRLFSICERHKVLIISDEIHQDLITGPTPFTPTLSVCNGVYKDNIIAMSSVSKSFNMASLHQAEVIIPNEALRKQYTAYKAPSIPHGMQMLSQKRLSLRHIPTQRRKHGSQMYWLLYVKIMNICAESFVRHYHKSASALWTAPI